MKDMQTHLEKLRMQIVECELIRDFAESREKRALFDSLVRHLRELATQIEFAIRREAHPVRSPSITRTSRPQRAKTETNTP